MIELIVFIGGFCVMVMELAGARIIAPFLGSTYIVWTSIIGIIMTALSIGYYLGGKLSDKKTSSFILSFIFFCTGIYIAFLSLFQFSFLNFITELNLNIYAKTITTGLGMFLIPSILLGTITPYTINYSLKKRNIRDENRGSEIGKLYAFSTIGSILGTFLCGFYLILFFGIKTIFSFLGLILLLCSMFIIFSDILNTKVKKNILLIIYFLLQISVICIVFFSIYNNKINNVSPFKNTVASFDSQYGYIGVIDIQPDPKLIYNNKVIKTFRCLCNSGNIRNGIHSALYITENSEIIQAVPYIDMLFKIYDVKKDKKSILFLGIGGNSLLNKILNSTQMLYSKNNKYDLVEIDPYMIKVAKEYFFFKETPNTTIHIKDARLFINELVQNQQKNKYDIIFHDIYKSTYLIPYETITVEALEKIKYLLNDNGILAINVISPISGIKSNYLQQICKQLNTVFPVIKVYPLIPDDPERFQNIIIVGLKNNNKINKTFTDKLKDFEMNITVPNNIIPYTDNFAPFEKFIINNR